MFFVYSVFTLVRFSVCFVILLLYLIIYFGVTLFWFILFSINYRYNEKKEGNNEKGGEGWFSTPAVFRQTIIADN